MKASIKINFPSAGMAEYPKVSPPLTGGDQGEGEHGRLITPTRTLPRQGGGDKKEKQGHSLNQAGSALIITLLVVTTLVALTVEFAYEVYIDTTSLANWNNAQKASLIAKSGQTFSTKYIAEVKKRAPTAIGELTLPITKDLGTGTGLLIQMEDESAKLNINNILQQNLSGEMPYMDSLKNLLEYFNINPDIALIIADWIDSDSEPRLPRSEDIAKNAPLWSVEELKLIPGVNKEVFDRISPYITVFGDNLININTAKLPLLASLHPDMTETLAKRIIDYRETSPFEDTSHLQRVTGMKSIGIDVLGRISVKTSAIRVTSRATVNDITRIIESIMDTSYNILFWREA
ncbi:MAG: general secretion pathway protein GspK [Nitrospiraceae bacterium]|nr:MAG: general secretion pathway protein GspK [Nitrospiraceae bacterium]